MVTVMRFVEDLFDCQAADAVSGCIDWKYALELDDPGFNVFVPSEFRALGSPLAPPMAGAVGRLRIAPEINSLFTSAPTTASSSGI